MEVKPYHQLRLPDPSASIPVLPSYAEKPAKKRGQSPRWYQEHPTFRYLAPGTKLSDNSRGTGSILVVEELTLGKIAETSGGKVRFTLEDKNGVEHTGWAMYNRKGGFEKLQDPQQPFDKPD